MEFKKVVLKAEDYPKQARTIKLECGDEFYISYKGVRFKAGQKYYEYPAIVKRVVYKPKPWYSFWKKKEIYGYFIQWIGE